MNTRQIAHEIKNQLSILDIYVNILEKKPKDTEAIEIIKKSIASIKGLVDEFKNPKENAIFEEKYVSDVIKKSISLYEEILKEKNNRITLKTKENPKINIDEKNFSLVVNNIIKNAHEATRNDEIIIEISKKDNLVEIDFINHGEEIKKENQNKIFGRNFTTKNNGWGEGLSACLEIIESQKGSLKLKKSDEKETIFTITMPAC